MKRTIFCFALALNLTLFSHQKAFCESTWEFNERHLGMESVSEKSAKQSAEEKKALMEKCDADFDSCQEKAKRFRKSCTDGDEDCIKEYRRQNALCLSAAEKCEKAKPGGSA